MTRFSDVGAPLRESSIKDVYFRPLTFNRIRGLRDVFDGADDQSPNSILLYAFEHLFCDQNGEPFSDVKSEDDLGNVDVKVSAELMDDLREILEPPKSQETASPS